jgi:Leucine-rich repeat (LRR) protein
LGALPLLSDINLSNNRLVGNILLQPEDFPALQFLNLSENRFTGPVPARVAGFPLLRLLDLSGNRLEGPVPAELKDVKYLTYLDLGGNMLTGVIPPGLGNLTGLTELDLHDNQLEGPIPVELAALENLQVLYLHDNRLSGIIPVELSNLPGLVHLDLSNNLLAGTIPPGLRNLSKLNTLDLAANSLEGNIPVRLSELEILSILDLHDNRLEGPVPESLADIERLKELNLSGNRLTGTIPAEIGVFYDLDYLDLSHNRLTGAIPGELGKLIDLEYFDLSYNRLTGTIPGELGNLTVVNYLYLSSNQLEGAIPPGLVNLSHLIDNASDFRWNRLYTDDPRIRQFLAVKQIGGIWEDTQTTAPQGVKAQAISGTSIEVSWEPIAYTRDEGGYRLLYSKTQGGPYKLFGSTGTKHESRIEFPGAEPFTKYYFVVQTRTGPHEHNQNTSISRNSVEVSASTRGKEVIVSGRVIDVNDNGFAGITMIFSNPDRTGATDASGYYRFAVPRGWSGTVKPLKTGYTIVPEEIVLENVTGHRRDIDFRVTPVYVPISGNVLSLNEGVAGVVLTYTSSGGETKHTDPTNAQGSYKFYVPYGWTGRVTPSKGRLLFHPPYTDYGAGDITQEEKKKGGYQLSVSIVLDVSLRQDRTVLIKKGYGDIQFNVNIIGISPGEVQSLVLYRKDSGSADSAYEPIASFPVQEPYSFTYHDKYIEDGQNYTYIGRALDAAGYIIGESKAKTIANI